MICSYCGGTLAQEAKFCTYCGNELSSGQKAPIQESSFPSHTPVEPVQQSAVGISKPAVKKPLGKFLLCGVCGTVAGALLLAVILLAAGLISFGGKTTGDSGGKTIEGPGFSTPEEAAKAYLTGLRDQDLDAMLATYAVESFVDNFDFEASLDQMNAYYSFNYGIMGPNTNDYTRQLNIAARRDKIARQISMQYMYYNTPAAFNNDSPVMLEDAKAIKNFIGKFEKDINNNIFDDLVITGTLAPEDLSDFFLDEQNQDSLDKQAKVYGLDGDDFVNVAVTFKADKKTWIFCPQLVRYDNKWYLESSEGNLSLLLYMEVFMGGIAPFDLQTQ